LDAKCIAEFCEIRYIISHPGCDFSNQSCSVVWPVSKAQPASSDRGKIVAFSRDGLASALAGKLPLKEESVRQ
jgi:hypothetical protein